MTTLALSMSEAAKQAGISRAKLYEYIKIEDGPRVTKLGRRSVILTEDLLDWLRAMRDRRTERGNTL